MANQTVYPYGTGGSLPSSIGIINDCTTGGSDKALAAQQGIVLKGAIDQISGEIVNPVLSFVGNGTTYASGIETEGILLKGHNYRFYLMGFDLTGLSITSTSAVAALFGTGEDGTTVQAFRIDRGTGTFVAPEYVEYTPSQNIYGLRFDGRNKSGTTTKLVIDDYGENSFIPTLSLDGADTTYVNGADKFVQLYKGHYRLNILQWDVSTVSDMSLPVVVLLGANGNGDSVVLVRYTKTDFNKNPRFIDFTISENMYGVFLSGRAKSGTKGIAFIEQKSLIGVNSLDFPVLGCGNKMLSQPVSTYTHLPKIVETAQYIFVLYSSSKYTTVETVGDVNDTVLCIINKATGEQWYETIFDCKHPETVDGNTCLYNHNCNMINVSATSVVVTVGCVNDGKFMFINKTYNAATRTIGAVEKSTLTYGSNTVDMNLLNYIQMANSVYSLSIPESDSVANSADIWNPSTYTDGGVTKYIALFSFKTSSADATPYIMMNSTDGKNWSPLFLLQADLKSGESSAIVVSNKIYLTNRIGGSQSQDNAYGQFYGVCDMSGNMLKAWEKINVQRTRPCEVAIGGTVYIIYNDGSNSGKYWGRTKAVIAKVNADYSLTEIKSFTSPYGYNYQSACDHNGAMLIVYAEDVRGYNAGTNNAVTDIAIAQFYDFNS